MVECLRFFRLGIINLVGITVPGLLILLFFLLGFAIPLATLVLPFAHELTGSDVLLTLQKLMAFYDSNKGIIVLLFLILAYTTGYIIRLSTPDDLDKISADKVLVRMNEESTEKDGKAAQRDHWPYHGEPGNKFPYFHFKDYLISRGLPQHAELVTWGLPEVQGCGKRTKTLVNLMKIEVSAKCPDLSAVIESNEAHVRLMFGTWLAITTCRGLTVDGLILSTVGLLVLIILNLRGFPQADPPYLLFVLTGSLLLTGMHWATKRIENLFHYQRVRELTHIVGGVFLTREMNKPNTAD